MRVITLTGSPRFPSPDSALLEYAREQLTLRGIEVCHWHIQNFTPEDLWLSRRISPALQTFQEQLASACGVIIATPYTPLPGALQRLLSTFPPQALAGKAVLSVTTGIQTTTVAANTPLFTTLGARLVLPELAVADSQIDDYQHNAHFTPALQQILDNTLAHFFSALISVADTVTAP